MTTSLVKSILVGLAAVTASVTIVMQHQKSVAMAEELSQLRAQVQISEAAYAGLVEQSKTKPRRVPQADTNQDELLQLRNEVGRLRASAKAQEQAMAFLKTRQQPGTGSVEDLYQDAKRSAIACLNTMRQIDGATQQWALENKKGTNAVVAFTDLAPFFKNAAIPVCPMGGQYVIGKVADDPSCTLHGKMDDMTKSAFPQQ